MLCNKMQRDVAILGIKFTYFWLQAIFKIFFIHTAFELATGWAEKEVLGSVFKKICFVKSSDTEIKTENKTHLKILSIQLLMMCR